MRNQISYKEQGTNQKSTFGIIIRTAICIFVLMIGVLGMATLASLKKPPADLALEERPIRVDVINVTPQDYPVTIKAYGNVKAQTSVPIAAEVSGRVVATHERLDVGEIIPVGEVLFEVEDRKYRTKVEEAKSLVSQFKSNVVTLQKQYKVDNGRLGPAKRNLELTRADYIRTKKLFEESKVGTKSGVEMAEKAFNIANDSYTQLASKVDLYPIQIKESQTSLDTARIRLKQAETDLDRCKVRAPFTGRLAMVNVEKDAYISPGAPVVSIVDDSMLEVRVSIDSQNARKWLRFSENDYNENKSWFSRLEPVACKIRWTEMDQNFAWEGFLHRVVKFDPLTRTITLAIRVSGDSVRPQGDDWLPLVEGMFCEVEIPGRTLRSVYKLPRWAVSFHEEVYLVKDSRLKTQKVKVVRSEGDTAYVSNGLKPGDQVIVTRLMGPLENSLLDVTNEVDAFSSAGDRS